MRSGASPVRALVVGVLAGAGVLVLAQLYDFGQRRFFSVDEWQYGHATWLVSEGRLPYVDFYEHHFPASYVAHAPLLWPAGSFEDRALRLRAIPFAYVLLVVAALGATGIAARRDPCEAVLGAWLPFVPGFGLFSVVDYRADTFAACVWLVCLALLEWNRGRGRAGTAAVSGACFAFALLMTQKMGVAAGGTLAVFLCVDAFSARRRRAGGHAPLLARPGAFAAGALALLAPVLVVGAAAGALPAAFEATVLHALAHESLYPEVPLGRYAAPWLEAAPVSTAILAALALVYLTSREGLFWAVPLGLSLGATALSRAHYPYNYVFPCMLLGLCAARGLGRALRAARPRAEWSHVWRPLLYLPALALVPSQLGFALDAPGNRHQLMILDKIERFTADADAVIDGAGGALFRDHGSYYWYHGIAHREMFAEYFRSDLVADYRRSAALFWIHDFRLDELPQVVRDYFYDHYVSADGNLHALGFLVGETGSARAVSLDVIRAGAYRVFAASVHATTSSVRLRPDRSVPGLRLGGHPVRAGEAVELGVGPVELRVPADAPPLVVTPLPAEVFESRVAYDEYHTPLFELDARRGPPSRPGRQEP